MCEKVRHQPSKMLVIYSRTGDQKVAMELSRIALFPRICNVQSIACAVIFLCLLCASTEAGPPVDECTAGTHNCDANAACVTTPTGFGCMCASGYTGDGVTCIDVDECGSGAHNCDVGAVPAILVA